MHIQFNKIRYKNILSVGNQFIEIDFEKTKTTMIMGANGQGKSLMLDAIIFALYNRSFRKINKPQLINSINNKDLLVEIFFSVGPTQYMIRRGMKPAVFEIWKDGDMLNKDAKSMDYQQYLEESILRMSYKSFTQIVILGSATYIPFMELTTGQRREIIEDLLDIQIFSIMNQILKSDLSENKDQLAENKHDVSLLETKIESAKEHNDEIAKMKNIEIEKLKAKAKEYLNLIDDANEKRDDYLKDVSDLSSSISDKPRAKATSSKIENLLHDLIAKKILYEKELRFYSDHDNCPTCKQGIEEEFKNNTIKERSEKIVEFDSAIEQLKNKKNKIEDRLEEISETEDKIRALNSKANEQRLTIDMNKKHLTSIKNEITSVKEDVEAIDQSKIELLSEELKKHRTEQLALHEKREILGVVGSMLKDGGIKTSIIKTYIPVMNKIINQYLSEFELFVDFNLDDNFNETIKSRFRDKFSFSSFSEGEKMRINLSIMFAWRALAKLRNSISTNILVLDEVLDSGSDEFGVESLIEILHKMHDRDNIFVISHRGSDFSSRFDRTLHFKKIKNFTTLVDSEI